MTGRASWLPAPFVALVYAGLLAPLVVVIAVSLGPSPNFEFPPSGLTLRWFEAFFASEADARCMRLSFVTASVQQIDTGIAALAAAIREHHPGN